MCLFAHMCTHIHREIESRCSKMSVIVLLQLFCRFKFFKLKSFGAGGFHAKICDTSLGASTMGGYFIFLLFCVIATGYYLFLPWESALLFPQRGHHPLASSEKPPALPAEFPLSILEIFKSQNLRLPELENKIYRIPS